MIGFTPVFLLLALIQGEASAGPIPETEVTGTIATRVEFRGAARVKVIEATLDLLKSCAYSHRPTEGPMPEWDGSLKEVRAEMSHIHILLDAPRIVTIAGGPEKVKVSEMLVVFPLHHVDLGGIWVRADDRAKRFAKYSPVLAVELQKLLKLANPID